MISVQNAAIRMTVRVNLQSGSNESGFRLRETGQSSQLTEYVVILNGAACRSLVKVQATSQAAQ